MFVGGSVGNNTAVAPPNGDTCDLDIILLLKPSSQDATAVIPTLQETGAGTYGRCFLEITSSGATWPFEITDDVLACIWEKFFDGVQQAHLCKGYLDKKIDYKDDGSARKMRVSFRKDGVPIDMLPALECDGVHAILRRKKTSDGANIVRSLGTWTPLLFESLHQKATWLTCALKFIAKQRRIDAPGCLFEAVVVATFQRKEWFADAPDDSIRFTNAWKQCWEHIATMDYISPLGAAEDEHENLLADMDAGHLELLRSLAVEMATIEDHATLSTLLQAKRGLASGSEVQPSPTAGPQRSTTATSSSAPASSLPAAGTVAGTPAGLLYAGDLCPGGRPPSKAALLQVIGSKGKEKGKFTVPYGVAAGRFGIIAVADYLNNRFQVFSKDGAPRLCIGAFGDGDGMFINCLGIAVDHTGRIIVTDRENHRIQLFSCDGHFLGKFGCKGSGQGQFFNPSGVAIDKDGCIVVVDTWNHRVQRFSGEGQYLSTVGSYGEGDGPHLHYPVGLAIDQRGNYVIADLANHRVKVFSPDGALVKQFGCKGTGDGQFNEPHGVAIDHSGYIVVSDRKNHRIQVFSSDGTFVAKFGTLGDAPGQFNNPIGVAVDTEGRILVADSGNDRIQVVTMAP